MKTRRKPHLWRDHLDGDRVAQIDEGDCNHSPIECEELKGACKSKTKPVLNIAAEAEDGVCRFCGDFVHTEDGYDPGPHWSCQIKHLSAALTAITKMQPQQVLDSKAKVGDPDAIGWNFAMVARRALVEVE